MPLYVDARLGIQRTGGRVVDFFDIRLDYDDKLVILKSSYLVREQGPRFTLHGTEGSFVKSGIDPQEQDLKDKKIPGSRGWGVEPRERWGTLNTSLDGKHIREAYESVPGNYLGFYDNLYDALRRGHPLAVQPEESRNGIRIIEACHQSSRTRSAIKM
jgi:predicted dehydrogenase